MSKSSPEYKKAVELMGKKVLVKERLFREANDDKRYWKSSKLPVPRVGWVTGIRWLQSGYITSGYGGGYGYSEYDYEPPYMVETGPRTPCLLVTFWPTENPVKAPVDAVELTEDDAYATSGFGEEPERSRYIKSHSEVMKKEAKFGLNRNEKGQFIG